MVVGCVETFHANVAVVAEDGTAKIGMNEKVSPDRKGVENYQLLLGGSEGADTSLGTITGPGFSEDGVVAAIETATDVYLANKQGSERFLDTYRRIGMAPFKEAIYAPSPAKQEEPVHG